MLIFDILEQSAKAWPGRPAIVDARGALSYEALRRQAESLSERLRASGVRPGVGVGVMGRDSRAFVLGVFAALRAGAGVLPMARELDSTEIAQMTRDVSTHFILKDAGDDPAAERLAAPDSEPLRLARTDIALDAPFAGGMPDIAFARFTSGTTGRPKGVALSHANILDRTQAANRALRISDSDVVLWAMSMAYHFFVSITLYLRYGATIVLGAESGSEDDLLRLAERHGATVLYASPERYERLSAMAPASEPSPLSRLRLAISTSTGLKRRAALEFHARHGAPVSQAYGIIEVGLPLVNTEAPLERPESVGRPSPDYEIAIRDEEGRETKPGEPGELMARGPGMFSGYLGEADASPGLERDGWFATGDLARRDAEGFIEILGRRKSAFRIGGKAIVPEQIEAELEDHPNVARARVRRSGDAQNELQIDIVCRSASDASAPPADPEEISSWLRDRLPEPRIATRVRFVEQIPRTRSGKVSRE